MTCAVHPETEAVGFCRHCGKALCSACAHEVGGAFYCGACLTTAVAGQGQAAAPPASGANPGAAAAIGLIPGLGAVYNGEYNKAIVHIAIWGGLFAIGLSSSSSVLTPLAWIAFGLFPVYMSIDAYRVARSRQLLGSGATGDAVHSAGSGRMPVAAMVLIAIGVLALLDNFGMLQSEWVDKGWPLILIGLGIWLIVRQSRRSS